MRFDYEVDYENKKIRAVGWTKNGLSFDGTAKCHPDDKFDAKIGKQIARNRAEIKQLKWISKGIDKYIDDEYLKILRVTNRQEKIIKNIEKKIIQVEELKIEGIT